MKIIQPNPQQTVIDAVNKYVDFIKVTYGPAGKKILLSNKAIDDGKIASQEFELFNEHENHVITFIKETTAKTDERVGDGTTTSAILMSELVKRILTPKDDFTPVAPPRSHILKLKKALAEAVASVRKSSKEVKTAKELYEVAHSAYNNPEIAKLISDTLFTIGKNGSLSVHDSHSMTTEVEIAQGLEIDKGFVTPYLINKEDRVALEDPQILVVAEKIDTFKSLIPLIGKLLESGKKNVVIVAEGFGEEPIATAVVNKLKGVFNPLLVEAPGFGDKKRENLEDIAIVVGATLVDPKKGDSLDKATIEVLGSAAQVVAKKDSTVFIGGKGTKKAITERVAFINGTLDKTSKYAKEKAEERIAKLCGGVAVIRVGAATENEQKTVRAKVEDAVNATKAAYRGGIVPGAGRTLESITTSSDVLNHALKQPRVVLEENGVEFLDEKVYDSTEVVIAALETAVSVAAGLVEIGGIISEKRKKEDKDY